MRKRNGQRPETMVHLLMAVLSRPEFVAIPFLNAGDDDLSDVVVLRIRQPPDWWAIVEAVLPSGRVVELGAL